MHWQDMTWPEIGALDRDRTIVVLPLGSVEQHGHHMPLGTDTMLANAVSAAAAAARGPRPWRPAAALVRLFGPPHALPRHRSRSRAETMMAMVGDIVASVVAHGFRRIAHRQRPWRQRRRHRRARLDARPPLLRRGAHRVPDLFHAWRATRSSRTARVASTAAWVMPASSRHR